jgi:hypothetical protein
LAGTLVFFYCAFPGAASQRAVSISRTALAAESVARREDAEIARGALRVRPNGYQQTPPRADDDEDKCRETGGDETDALGTKPRPGRCDTVCACRQID